MQITIIDDDVNARIIAATLLELRGFEVQTIQSNEIDSANLEASELVLFALESAGIGRLRSLQRRFADGNGPALVATLANDTADARRFAERLRPDAILVKPLDPRCLIRTVETLLIDRVDQPAADAS